MTVEKNERVVFEEDDIDTLKSIYKMLKNRCKLNIKCINCPFCQLCSLQEISKNDEVFSLRVMDAISDAAELE